MANTRRKPESTSTPLPKMTRKDLIQSVIGKTPRKKFLSEGQGHYFELLENKESKYKKQEILKIRLLLRQKFPLLNLTKIGYPYSPYS